MQKLKYVSLWMFKCTLSWARYISVKIMLLIQEFSIYLKEKSFTYQLNQLLDNYFIILNSDLDENIFISYEF